MIAYIISRLIRHTLLSLILAAIAGSLIGLMPGAMRQRVPDTVYMSVVGAFLGCILVSAIPPTPVPGSLESWGSAGGLGSLSVLVCVFFIGLGGIVGSLVASTFGFRWLLKVSTQQFLWILAGVYGLLAFTLGGSYLSTCTPSMASSLSYC